MIADALARYAPELDVVHRAAAPYRGRSWSPDVIVWHHDAIAGNLSVGRYAEIGRTGGRGGGPLAHAWVLRDGRWLITCDAGYVAGVGRVNSHRLAQARRGDPPPDLDAAAADLEDHGDGNPWTLNIECANDGVGEPWPFAQLDSLVRGTAALALAANLTPHHVRHHRQLTRRKPDMSYRGDLWTPVAMHMLAKAQGGREHAIAQAYRDLLGREPDAAGLAHWTGSTLSIGEIRAWLARSPEARRHAIAQAYRTLLGREPDPDGLAWWAASGLDLDEIARRLASSPEARR